MRECDCAYCKNEKGFAFPPELLERIASGDVVIFAGAGISTENRAHCKTTLYEEIKHELAEERDLDFPSLMDAYCAQPDGRIKLIQKIKKRVDYFSSFRGFRVPMTRFHRAILPLYMITDIITTNWDNYFEEESGFTPFVYDQDIALLEGSRRRVIKIHGSLTNFGSIVATTSDYSSTFRRLTKGPLGAYVKNILSSKTIIYTGYSLRDSNYLRIAKTIAQMMGPFRRQSYFVSPNIDRDYLESTNLNIIPIETDGSFFFEQFRLHHKSSHQCIIDDSAFDDCHDLLLATNDLHHETADRYLSSRRPLLILALAYQDGLQDALMRIKDQRRSGEYYNAHHLHNLVRGYEMRVRQYRKESNHWDACYCRGYQNGLIYLLAGGGDVYPPPVELLFDKAIDTVPKAMRFPRNKLPKRVQTELSRLSKRVGQGPLIPEHIPYA
ncbi:MAG: SIR2 family protein [Aquamicrobium sp.]|nr:SIR2 family protein [Aquamicrobium sp.]